MSIVVKTVFCDNCNLFAEFTDRPFSSFEPTSGKILFPHCLPCTATHTIASIKHAAEGNIFKGIADVHYRMNDKGGLAIGCAEVMDFEHTCSEDKSANITKILVSEVAKRNMPISTLLFNPDLQNGRKITIQPLTEG